MSTSIETTTVLKQRWRDYRTANPKTRIRDAAGALGVSEAELLATQEGETVTRLGGEWRELIGLLPTLGRCMALTRNEACVSEVRGSYGGVEISGHVGQVIGQHIDLRVFMRGWRHGFALEEGGGQGEHGTKRSLQFFDASGTAVHKVFLEAEGDADAFDKLRTAFAAPGTPLVIEPAVPRAAERPDADVDVAQLHARWDAMQDTHEFFIVLRDLGLSRLQALRLAGPDRARPVTASSMNHVLSSAAASHGKIMIFVGSQGVLQVRSGEVINIQRMGPWLNVLDPEFNLHLREDLVAASWVVRKPTSSGLVTSLELFDAAGDNILLTFAKRDDRAQEEEPGWWRALLGGLEVQP